MTGFGTADGSALGGRLRIEIRTVNHRYYNPQFRLPFELSGMEGPLRDRLRQLLDRGHVAVTARRLDAIAELARGVEARAPARLGAELERLKKAVTELAAGVRVDEQRLAVEIALLADRVDITEELVRLRTHVAACREALAKEGAVGKQLGFLAQEVLREVNTIGSKANDAAITQAVIAMKGELEKFREQLENLE